MKKFKSTGFLAIVLLSTGFAYSIERQENKITEKQAQKVLLNARDVEGATPLHRAVENNHFESAKTLLENGARPNVKDKNGQTPLHRAVQLKNAAEFIELLIKHGARPNARDTQDRRAIDLTNDSKIQDLLIALGTRIRKNKPLAQAVALKENEEKQASSVVLEDIPAPVNTEKTEGPKLIDTPESTPDSQEEHSELSDEAEAQEKLQQILEEIILNNISRHNQEIAEEAVEKTK